MNIIANLSRTRATAAQTGTEPAGYKVVRARHPWRVVGTLAAGLLIAMMLQSVLTNPRWGWDVFAHWFFAAPVLAGLGRTLALTAMASVLGFALGTALALARVSGSPLLAALAWFYTWLLRSIPLIVLLLVLYNFAYLYQSIRLGIPFTDVVIADYPTMQILSQSAVAVLGLSLNQAAFSSEIIRGGILSVDQGQLEAAAALGLPRWRQVFRIVLPQAMRSIIPGGFNEVIGLAKGTSMVYVLALPELFYTVQVIYQRNMEVIPLLMVATFWYIIILSGLSIVQVRIERHFARGALRTMAPTAGQRLHSWLKRSVRAPAATPASPPPAAPSSPGKHAQWPHGTGGDVRIEGVSKCYGTHWVLQDVDLHVRPGEVMVILGPSGSGKSTLLRTINALEKVDSGAISVDGEFIGYRRQGNTLYELKEKDVLKRRAAVGMVFQAFNLFPHMTVLDNIAEGPVAVRGQSREQARGVARDLLARVGLSDRESAYPRQLSGGQQQRVAIARTLALAPRVLLFDEPTSALDPELVGEVLEVIRELARSGTTLIIVTHEIGFAREVADRVVFMDAGRILEQGPPSQVLSAPSQPRTQEFLAKVL